MNKIPYFFGLESSRKSPKKSHNFFQYEVFVRIFSLIFLRRQIWLNIRLDDRHFGQDHKIG